MPLRLKSLELHGYKTFAIKTNFEFAKGITAIVGPNGSGKSNIADALRWVLGEQSYSILRAKKTEDMIFAGSEQKPRSGMASAGLIFDNSDNWLPVDFTEVSLSRRAYRDGRNEYLLNGQHVRLKDINELLAQSGLSERTYTILGQGLVDASLALKADERRRLFEEAAGIGLYRARREETLRRLDTTRRNLERVLDILAELAPRLRSLEKQSDKAREFSQIQADLKALLLIWYGYHWHSSQNDLTQIMDISRSQEAKLLDARGDYQEVRQEFSEFRDRLNGLRARLNSWHRLSAQLHESRETTSGDLAKLEERQRALQENKLMAKEEHSRLLEEMKYAKEGVSETTQETNRRETEFNDATLQFQKIQGVYTERRGEKDRIEKEVEIIQTRVDELSARQTGLMARSDELSARTKGLQEKKFITEKNVVSVEKEYKEAVQRHGETVELYRNREISFGKVKEDLQRSRNSLSELGQELNGKIAAQTALVTEKAKLEAQLDVLNQAEQSLEGYAEGTKILLNAARQLKLKGTRGALSGLLEIPENMEVAISSALGEYTDALILNSGKETDQALEILGGEKQSRASILPLDWLHPLSPIKPSKDPGCVGNAADLVNVSPDFRPAVDLLLGQVLIARDRASAKRILSSIKETIRVVTLQGEVFHSTGQILAGKTSSTGMSISRNRKRKEIQDFLVRNELSISELKSEIINLEKKIGKVQKESEALEKILADEKDLLEKTLSEERNSQGRVELTRNQMDFHKSQQESMEIDISKSWEEYQSNLQAIENNEKEIAQAKEELSIKTKNLESLPLDEIQEQLNYWTTVSAVAEQALSDTRSKIKEREEAFTKLVEQQNTVDYRLSEINKSLSDLEAERKEIKNRAGEINAQLEETRNLIQPAEKELESAELKEEDLKKKEIESQEGLSRIERTFNQVQLELGRKQEMLEGLRRKIEDDFGLVAFQYASDVAGPVPLPLEGMVEQLPVIDSLPPDLEENMNRLRVQLRRMGAINPDAQQEFQAVKERHTFLTSQMDDLHKAEADLHQVINELDELTRNEFKKTFDLVADHFHTIFHRLFGGGNANLILTDPDNLTETGIDIEARLPGRREQGLALLSGGERSLTAIGLVFALLKVSPTPVCVMDEVDAMLDEANVGRFRDLLLELSKETQFIIITHNRNTVQAADVIYGITMGRDSTSQIISLKLDEVSEEYLK